VVQIGGFSFSLLDLLYFWDMAMNGMMIRREEDIAF
jgi:hypothetical protein